MNKLKILKFKLCWLDYFALGEKMPVPSRVVTLFLNESGHENKFVLQKLR